ncbi:hypothetical protein [Dongia sedimenti]|uniref:C-type lysozyme inhibitor domain-containing protein n=1 Tax=Dongia sedimenti TaxID=3064282 RepID=A0ABU0YIY1_9PROT|nr:hypothetical protein [Rhodospirillaceae bacterium R-7]
MGRGLAFGAAVLGVLVLGGEVAQAVAVPYSLNGTWVCTFPNGQTATIKARAGRQGVSYQRSGEDAHNLFISNTDDGGIGAHGDGWAWTLTPKDGAAVLVVDAKAKGETYKASCAAK